MSRKVTESGEIPDNSTNAPNVPSPKEEEKKTAIGAAEHTGSPTQSSSTEKRRRVLEVNRIKARERRRLEKVQHEKEREYIVRMSRENLELRRENEELRRRIEFYEKMFHGRTMPYGLQPMDFDGSTTVSCLHPPVVAPPQILVRDPIKNMTSMPQNQGLDDPSPPVGVEQFTIPPERAQSMMHVASREVYATEPMASITRHSGVSDLWSPSRTVQPIFPPGPILAVNAAHRHYTSESVSTMPSHVNSATGPSASASNLHATRSTVNLSTTNTSPGQRVDPATSSMMSIPVNNAVDSSGSSTFFQTARRPSASTITGRRVVHHASEKQETSKSMQIEKKFDDSSRN